MKPCGASERDHRSLTESDVAALVPLVFATVVMIAAWLCDAAALRIHPASIFALGVLTLAVASASILRPRGAWTASWSWRRLIAFLSLGGGFAAYVCWLAWPSLLPLTDGPDLVHHLSLIHFIQRRHALPNDPVFARYLGEMASYTPGSHLLAAIVAEWLRVDAVRVVHPVLALAVALKAGLIYNTLTRLLPGFPANIASSIAGTLLLLLPHRYLLEPLTVFGFYSQVVAETFAVAALWAILAWHQRPSRTLLALASLFLVAVVLSWPVYFPVPALAFVIVVALRWHDGRPVESTLADVLLALGPAVVTIATFAGRHPSSAGILRSGGSVLVPSVGVFGWPFVVFAAMGAVIVMRRLRTTAPIVAFAAAALAQIGALAVLQSRLGATNLYLANKTVFLLVSPAVIVAALAVDTIWRFAARLVGTLPAASFPLPASRKIAFFTAVGRDRAARLVTACSPLAVVALLLASDLPRHSLPPPLSEPLYHAGHWAQANVPSGCVDYLVERWITGYWLHLDVLGNARASERMRTETFEYKPTVGRWVVPDGAPFAIVENLATLPADARRNMTVLYQSGSAAVVRRSDGGGTCADEAPGIDRVGTASD